MKVVDIADEIFRELGSPTTLSIPPIAFWVRTNLGGLNSKLNTVYVINSTSMEIEQTTTDIAGVKTTTEIGDNEKYILKKMYLIHFYDVQIRNTLGAASTDAIIEIEADGTRVKKVNKTEQGRWYQNAKRTELEELKNIIHLYRNNSCKPLQVAGDDSIHGTSHLTTFRPPLDEQ